MQPLLDVIAAMLVAGPASHFLDTRPTRGSLCPTPVAVLAHTSNPCPSEKKKNATLHGTSRAVWAPAAQSSLRLMSRSDRSIDAAKNATVPFTACQWELVTPADRPTGKPSWTARAASTLHASLMLITMGRTARQQAGLLHHWQASQQQELPMAQGNRAPSRKAVQGVQSGHSILSGVRRQSNEPQRACCGHGQACSSCTSSF